MTSSRKRLSIFLQLPAAKKGDRDARHPDKPHISSPSASITSFFPKPAFSPTTSTFRSSFQEGPASPVHLSARIPQSGSPVPPTRNDLDAEEKARLLKKARKLSRVFGQIPDLTNGYRQDVPASHVHRRSLSSVTTSETSSSSGHSTRRCPSQPNLRKASMSTLSRISEVLRPSRDVEDSNPPAGCSSTDEDSHSLAPPSPVHPHTPLTPEQQRRARAAKLSRFLGENIPPELISDPSAGQSPRFGDSAFPPSKRRKSIDSSTIRSEASSHKDQDSLKRSRTMSGKLRPSVTKDPAFQQRYRDSFWASSKMSPEERARAVKRAKMTQLFGQDFPKDFLKASPPTGQAPGLKKRKSSETSTPEHPPNPPQSRRSSSVSSLVDPDPRERFSRPQQLDAEHDNFFGVEYQDIRPSLPVHEVAPPVFPSATVHIDVKTSPRRFWFFGGDKDVEDVDVNTVIGRLRGLRAS